MAEKKAVAYFLRHGSALHEDELMAGRGCDFPLSDKGEAEAAAAAKELKKLDFGLVYCSPMLRAVQTAEIAVAPLGGRCITQCRCLFPWALGPQFDGAKKRDMEEELAYLIAHPSTKPEHGQSLVEFRDGVADFLESVFNRFSPPLLVTHSNVICVTKDLVDDTMDSCPGLEDGVTPAGIMAVYEDGDDGYCWEIVSGTER